MRVLFTKSWNDAQPNGDNIHYKAGIERDVDDDIAMRAIQAGRALDMRVAHAMKDAGIPIEGDEAVEHVLDGEGAGNWEVPEGGQDAFAKAHRTTIEAQADAEPASKGAEKMTPDMSTAMDNDGNILDDD